MEIPMEYPSPQASHARAQGALAEATQRLQAPDHPMMAKSEDVFDGNISRYLNGNLA